MKLRHWLVPNVSFEFLVQFTDEKIRYPLSVDINQ